MDQLNKKNDSSQWQPCRPGMLQGVSQLASSADQESRRQFLTSAVGMVGAAVVVAGATSLFLRRNEQPNSTLPTGIACAQVEQYLVAFVNNQLDDRELFDRIDKHLIKCKSCYAAYQKLPKPPGKPYHSCAG